MLLRYTADNTSQVEEVSRLHYDDAHKCVCIESNDAVIKVLDFPKSKWNALLGDIFVDGRLALPEEYKINRIPRTR